MKTFVGLFASSSIFGASIAIIYWFASHDYAGTFLLGFMFIALAYAAGWAFIAERDAKLSGDDPQLTHKQAAGEDVGIVTKESPWPIVLAFSILWFVIGLLWSDFMIFTGLAAMLLAVWRLGAESARVGHKRIMTKEGPQDVT
jgi:hypothetical protein